MLFSILKEIICEEITRKSFFHRSFSLFCFKIDKTLQKVTATFFIFLPVFPTFLCNRRSDIEMNVGKYLDESVRRVLKIFFL